MSKLRKSARDQSCQVRIPGYCNFDSSTVVLAHLNGGGMGAKRPDWQGAFFCSACHDVIDGRVKSMWKKGEIRLWHLEGVIRTQEIWFADGLLEVTR